MTWIYTVFLLGLQAIYLTLSWIKYDGFDQSVWQSINLILFVLV